MHDRVRREANWQRRKAFVCLLVAAGLLPSEALCAAQQVAQALVDMAAAIHSIITWFVRNTACE